MNFLVIWLGTGALSFYMEMANELRVFKDAADEGYKINIEKLAEIFKQMGMKNSLLWLLIPVFNILKVLQNTATFNNERSILLTQLKVMNVLEEMDELEKTIYQQKPTGLNALLLPIKADIKLSKSEFIEYYNEIGEGKIYYERSKGFEDLTILKVTGPVSRLSVEEQKKIVIDEWTHILKSSVKFDDFEEFKTNILGDSVFDLVDGHESDDELAKLQSQKQELINLKCELLEQSNIQSDKDGMLMK